jgi:hypothetical protein
MANDFVTHTASVKHTFYFIIKTVLLLHIEDFAAKHKHTTQATTHSCTNVLPTLHYTYIAFSNKGKVHPRTGHESPDEERYSPNLP